MNAATGDTAAASALTAGWWQPPIRTPHGASVDAAGGDRVAFGALIVFTGILLLAPQTWLPILGTLRVAFLAAGVAIGAHLLDRIVGRTPARPFNLECGIAFALVAWAIITLPVSYWPAGSAEVLSDHYLKAVAFFWLIGTLATTFDRLRAFAWTLVLCAIPLSVTGLKHFIFGDVLSTGVPGLVRIAGYVGGSGLVGNPNDLALMLNLIIPIAVALMLDSRTVAARCVAGLTLLLSVAAVIVTFSRAGFLTLAAVVVVLSAGIVRRRSPLAATALILCALCAPPLLPDGYLDRLGTITNISTDATGSAQGRWNDFTVAANVVARNPMIGVGIGQDVLALNEQRGAATWRSVHNVYLQYAVDLGLPGVLLFAWLHWRCFRGVRAVERRAMADPSLVRLVPLAAGVQGSLVAFAVAAMFHPIAYQFYFFTVAGIAVALVNTCRAHSGAAPLVAEASS